MPQAIQWLRISFWTGAVIDALAAIELLSPTMFAAINRLPHFHPGIESRLAMGMAASLMAGWTFLLLWADQRPLERKAILIMTVIPVILGFVVTEIWCVSTNFLSLQAVLPTLALQGILIALFTFSYLKARRTEQRTTP